MGGAPREDATVDPPVGGGSTRAVLVVDVDAVARSAACRAIERAGMVAVPAADGRTALRLVAGGTVRPDVLLTVIELPRMSGIELAARILAMRPGVRVVMMTADEDRATAARDHQAIVATVLMKPLDPVQLVSAVGPPPTEVPR